ncbi:prepilin-type N-terminal cleavage/methylation domain-containing protein [Flavobacteriaceae bacterium GF1]
MIHFNQKIKAFTLSEMMVVLLLTVIVVGLAFSVLNLVQKQMAGVRKEYGANMEVRLLKQALWKDVRTFSRIYATENGDGLFCDGPGGQIQYLFYRDYIVRANDTFEVAIGHKKYYFMGRPIISGEVDALELQWNDSIRQPLLVYKINAAESFMD